MIYIDNYQNLNKLIQEINLQKLFGFDCEFMTEQTFYPKLCLIQIIVQDKIYLVDPLTNIDLDPIWNLFTDKNIIKVLHSGKNDLSIVQKNLNPNIDKNISNVFDLQIGACLCGFGFQIGLANLIEDIIGVKINKDQTRSNWLQRPLKQEQLNYAQNDVRYLLSIFQVLKNKLDSQNRFHWVIEEVQNEDYNPKMPEIKFPKDLNPYKKAKFEALCKLRYEYAKLNDITINKVVKDDVLINLINFSKDLKEIALKQNNFFINKNYDQISQILTTNFNIDKFRYPEIAKNDFNLTLNTLSFIADLYCKDLKIPQEILCPKRELEKIVKNYCSNNNDFTLRVFNGWRFEILGFVLKKILENKKYIVESDNILLHIELYKKSK